VKKLVFLLAAVLLVPASATAKPKDRPKLLQPLEDELTAKGELSKDLSKLLKVGEFCMSDDKRWDKAMSDGQTSISIIREMLIDSVVCWQRAEKKAGKLGEAASPAAEYYAARARYMETFRSFIWAIEAKNVQDRLSVCKRLKTAMDEAGAANTAADGLADKFTTEDGKVLALATMQTSKGLGEQITDEYANQRCE